MPKTGIGSGASRVFHRPQAWRPYYIPDCLLWLDANDSGSFTLNGAGELVTDGDMEAVGTAAWTVGNNAILTKIDHAGNQSLRIEYGGPAATPFAHQLSGIMIQNRWYHVTGRARGNGTRLPRISGIQVGPSSWVGVPSTDWQYFDFTHQATVGPNPRINLVCDSGAAPGDWVEFDDVSVIDAYPRVSAWADKSGNANHATQVVAANQPDYDATGGVGMLPGVLFTAASAEFMDIPGMTDPSHSWTVVAVINQGASTGTVQALIAWKDAGVTILSGLVGANFLGGYDGTAYRITASPILAGDQWVEYLWDGGTPDLEVFRDGASCGTVTYDGSGNIDSNVVISRLPTIASSYCNVTLSELMLYSRMLAADELALLRRYIVEKYGLAFSPASVPDLARWHRSDQGITLNGATVSAWDDLSGNARHLVQATASKQPLYVSSGGPGVSSPAFLEFDGVDDYLRRTDVGYNQPITRFMVILPSISDRTAGTMADGGVVGNSARLFLNAADTPAIYAGTAVVSTAGEASTWHYISTIFNGASSSIGVDGAAPVVGNAGVAAPNGLIVGIYGDTLTNPVDCRIAEIIEYNRTLSTDEIASVEAYIVDRYGL